jgi:hypothetical protein
MTRQGQPTVPALVMDSLTDQAWAHPDMRYLVTLPGETDGADWEAETTKLSSAIASIDCEAETESYSSSFYKLLSTSKYAKQS